MYNSFFVKKEVTFSDLLQSSWSGAIDTLKMIQFYELETEFMDLLQNVFYGETPEAVTVNDFLWHDTDYICECLGIDLEDYYNEKY